MWGHGFVNGRRIRTKSGGREDSRRAAGYVAKYLDKGYSSEDVSRANRHRYDVAKGFQPAEVKFRLMGTFLGVARAVCEEYGPAGHVWRSCDIPDWTGPPVWIIFHDGG
jgi:hypothetical protein